MTGRTYLVIGAGSAIGSCVARRLAADGQALVLAARDRSQIEALAGDVGGLVVQADATSFEDVERCAREAISLTGRLDGVLNCAGSIFLKPAHLTNADELSQVISTNLVSAFATVRAAALVMRQSGGSIVLISSAAAQIGLPNHEAIAAAKAGVIGLMRSAAATYASSGIRVNAVAPGLVDSPLSRSITSNDAALKASIAMHPLGRIGTPEDIANAIHWLIGPDSAWVTGQVIGVDGGLAGVRGRVRQ
ncbi:MAG: SDR family oxidoreductase [Vicinamibacterales bacterium]